MDTHKLVQYKKDSFIKNDNVLVIVYILALIGCIYIAGTLDGTIVNKFTDAQEMMSEGDYPPGCDGSRWNPC
jgi:hypothetical protein